MGWSASIRGKENGLDCQSMLVGSEGWQIGWDSRKESLVTTTKPFSIPSRLPPPLGDPVSRHLAQSRRDSGISISPPFSTPETPCCHFITSCCAEIEREREGFSHGKFLERGEPAGGG